MPIHDPADLAPDLSRPATPAGFAEAAMVSLRPVFGASRAVFSDRHGGGPGRMYFINWPSWCEAHYCAEVRARDPIRTWLDRVAASHDNGVARLSELTPAAPPDEPLLTDCGAAFVLTLALRDRRRIVGALSLVRDAQRGDFDERDRGLALSLLPLLEMAYGGLAARIDPAQRLADDGRQHALTRRESEVATLAAAGHSNKSIARMLGSSPWTIKNQMRAVLDKTGTRNRTELSALLGSGRRANDGN
ncbi:helix-turn-helix transcriptional regulator [Rhodopseudomonas sp. HC1]|uniref:helix-turn-helix transcriptional regulator n=1 Tax=Rhodopseudomonas infernalis TaxID=2897386 RepID=UPI001EE93B80|nr:helix-turn-helix transcriptional regulator [Rhodopseudomonas infernalis]MCG6203042.1 helix-turn-helix transcriptional regulator [Rhodopseudomonas infernalis]